MTRLEDTTGSEELVLVSAGNLIGEEFMAALNHLSVPVAAMTNSKSERNKLETFGIKSFVMVDNNDNQNRMIPEFPIGKVYLFERNLPLCCRYIQICRAWTRKPIYVVTQDGNMRPVYKALGADYVIHSRSGDVSFLLDGIR